MDINQFNDSFKNVEDFRQQHKVKHDLTEMLFIAVVGTIANANTWLEIGAFAEMKGDFLKKYVKLENGIPSHDTFQRVFEQLDSKSFNKAFMDWTNKLSDNSKGRIIAIDGKTVRGSCDGDKKAIHIVNAWVDENNLILGQVKTDSKSNEITAIPELLDLLFLKDSVVTIDAMGTQKDIVAKIIEKKGDYVLALKGNHGTFHKEVIEYMEDGLKTDFEDIKSDERKNKYIRLSHKTTKEKGHGRIETREYFQTNDINWFSEKEKWKNLKSIGMVKRTVFNIKKKTESVEISYYISSLEVPIDEECDLFAKAIRTHWGVESCHWMLDVVFKEDESLVRKNNGAENLSMLRKIAMNILKKENPNHKKMSKNMKRFRSSLNDNFLDEIVRSM